MAQRASGGGLAGPGMSGLLPAAQAAAAEHHPTGARLEAAA